jgi:hypothetical protein
MDEFHDARLRFLLETVALEAEHLLDNDGRLFAQPITQEWGSQGSARIHRWPRGWMPLAPVSAACRALWATNFRAPCWRGWVSPWGASSTTWIRGPLARLSGTAEKLSGSDPARITHNLPQLEGE